MSLWQQSANVVSINHEFLEELNFRYETETVRFGHELVITSFMSKQKLNISATQNDFICCCCSIFQPPLQYCNWFSWLKSSHHWWNKKLSPSMCWSSLIPILFSSTIINSLFSIPISHCLGWFHFLTDLTLFAQFNSSPSTIHFQFTMEILLEHRGQSDKLLTSKPLKMLIHGI
jgi:hypothetical protein